MSKKLQSAVICCLLASKAWIFEDEESGILKDIYGLSRKMFDEPQEHLTEKQRESLCTMLKAADAAPNLTARYEILDGRRMTSHGGGRDALNTWFTKQKVSAKMARRIDDAWDAVDVSPIDLIHAGLGSGEEFPNIHNSEGAKEDIMMAIFGDNALAQNPRTDFRDPFAAILHHSWERHRKRYNRAKKSLAPKRADAAAQIKALEQAPEVDGKMLRDATKAVKAYRDAVAWFPKEEERPDGVAEQEEFLKTVVVTAVAKARKLPKEKVAEKSENTPARKRGAARGNKLKPVSLAAAGDVEEIWSLYVQLFEVDAALPD
ncbi:hypothetical protein DFH29DRAFT_1007453, partial [Suillus ampliporus]